jgi:hypothetical protein
MADTVLADARRALADHGLWGTGMTMRGFMRGRLAR